MSLFQPVDRDLAPAARGFGELIVNSLSAPPGQ
jgi:hypothetical protein